MAVVLDPRIYWHCNACGADHVTSRAEPHTPLHPCFAMKGLMVPFVPKGSKAGMRTTEREDYVGSDIVDYTDGKVIMNVITEHDDGHTDCTVYPGCGSAQVTADSPRAALGSVASTAFVGVVGNT